MQMIFIYSGAAEIDIVISRTQALLGDWKGIYDEVRAMKEACGSAHLKNNFSNWRTSNLYRCLSCQYGLYDGWC